MQNSHVYWAIVMKLNVLNLIFGDSEAVGFLAEQKGGCYFICVTSGALDLAVAKNSSSKTLP